MGPLLATVNPPCFRKNVIATWKIVSFSCSLDNFLLEIVIVFIFGIHILKWRPFKKRVIFDPFFTFLVTREKDRQIPSANILLSWKHIFCSTFRLFRLTNFAKKKKKKTNLSYMVSLWYASWCGFLFAPFWGNQWITKWWAKLKLECLLLISIQNNSKFVVICKNAGFE